MREAEVAHGPDKELKRTEVILPVLEVTSTASVDTMITTGQLQASVEGVPVQNGLTTLNHVSRFSYDVFCGLLIMAGFLELILLFIFRPTSRRQQAKRYLKRS